MTDARERLLTALALVIASLDPGHAAAVLELLDDVRREREREAVEARR